MFSVFHLNLLSFIYRYYPPPCSPVLESAPHPPSGPCPLATLWPSQENSVWVGFMGHKTSTMTECRVCKQMLWIICDLAEHPLPPDEALTAEMMPRTQC